MGTTKGQGRGHVFNKNLLITPDGGICIKLVNKTGAGSIKGYLATPSDANDSSFILTPDDVPDNFGVIYGDDEGNSVADGVECWIIISGIGYVYFEAAVTRGHFVRSQINADGGTPGIAVAEAMPTSPFSVDKHFQEIGHAIESTGEAGLAKCVIHFN